MDGDAGRSDRGITSLRGAGTVLQHKLIRAGTSTSCVDNEIVSSAIAQTCIRSRPARGFGNYAAIRLDEIENEIPEVAAFPGHMDHVTWVGGKAVHVVRARLNSTFDDIAVRDVLRMGEGRLVGNR